MFLHRQLIALWVNRQKFASTGIILALLLGAFTGIQTASAAVGPGTRDVSCGDGTYTITYLTSDWTTGGYAGNGSTCTGDLVIDPSVAVIGDNAFWDTAAGPTGGAVITSVFTGVNVETISASAFKWNTLLTTVRMGEKTKLIGGSAFRYDGNLTTVIPGRNLVAIDELAFADTNFQTFTIPRSLETISNAFYSFTDHMGGRTGTAYYCGTHPTDISYLDPYFELTLTEFCLDSVSPDASSITGGKILTLSGHGTSPRYANKVFNINDVVYFGSESATILSVSGPNGETATVRAPSMSASSGLYVRVMHQDSGWAELATPSFRVINPCYLVDGETITSGSACSGNIVIGGSIKYIGDEAFMGNSDLTGVTFPEGLLSIGARAFKNAALRSISLPNSLTSMGEAAFEENISAFPISHTLTSVSIGNRLKEIPGDAFLKNNNLRTLTLGASVESIGFKAFSITGLETVTVSSSVKYIYGRAFEMSSLSAIYFEEGSQLVEIAEEAFTNTNLTSLSIPDSVTTLGVNIFGDPISHLTDVYYCRSTAISSYTSRGDTTGNWTSLITRLCPNGYKLSDLSISSGRFTADFDPTTVSYTASVGYSTDTQTITWRKFDSESSVRIRTGVASFSDPTSETNTVLYLLPGENKFYLKVDSIDGITFEIYTVTINRARPPFIPTGLGGFNEIQSSSTMRLDSIAASRDGRVVYALSYLSGVIAKSNDYGVSFAPLSSLPSLAWQSVSTSGDGSIVIAAAGPDGTSARVFYSLDSGITWVRSSTLGLSAAANSAISYDGSKIVLAGTNGQIFTSSDSGRSFTSKVANVAGDSSARALPVSYPLINISGDGQSLLASSWDSMYRSTDGGITWLRNTGITTLGGETGTVSVWSAPSGGLVLAAVQSDAIYKSLDFGMTWTLLNTLSGLTYNRYYGSISSSSDGEKILVGSLIGNFALSLDAGATWTYDESLGNWYSNFVSDGTGPMYLADYGADPGPFTSLLVRAAYIKPLSTTNGYTTGGTTVVINGTDFAAGIVVSFGGAAATVLTNTSTELTVRTTAHAAGLVDVTFTNPDTGFYRLPGAFTYVQAPVTDSPRVSTAVDSTPVDRTPRASAENPVIVKVSPNGGDFAAIFNNEGSKVDQKVSVSVPAGALTRLITFTLAPVSDVVSADGYNVIKLSATGISGTSLTVFAEPISITLPAGSSDSLPNWSIDGLAWNAIPKLTVKALADNQQDGYFVNEDGSVTLLTRHLTYFGTRMTQAPLEVTSSASSIDVKSSSSLVLSGGSGNGVVKYLSKTEAICSVSAEGKVLALALGTCQIVANKSGSELYADASATMSLNVNEVAVTVAPVPVQTPVKKIVIYKLSSAKSLIKINLPDSFGSRTVVLEHYSKAKGKSKEIILAKLKLNSSGDAVFTAKNLDLKGVIIKVKLGTKYIATASMA